jgi:hypothetical protein
MSEQSEPTEIVQTSEPVAEAVETVETEVEQDAQPDEGEEPRKPRGVQKRIDELTGNWRSAERERDHWREVAMRQIQSPQYQEPEPVYDDQVYYPDVENVQPLSPQSLLEQAKQLLRQEQEQQSMGEKAAKFKASVSDPETQDFLNSPYAPITTEMADIMLEHENGAQIAGWLARNQSEAARIAKLPPHKQALALMSAASTQPLAKRMTSAPAPIQRLAGKGAAAPAPENMSMDEYVAWRNSKPT